MLRLQMLWTEGLLKGPVSDKYGTDLNYDSGLSPCKVFITWGVAPVGAYNQHKDKKVDIIKKAMKWSSHKNKYRIKCVKWNYGYKMEKLFVHQCAMFALEDEQMLAAWSKDNMWSVQVPGNEKMSSVMIYRAWGVYVNIKCSVWGRRLQDGVTGGPGCCWWGQQSTGRNCSSGIDGLQPESFCSWGPE